MNEVIKLENVEKVYNIGKPNELKVLDDINLKIKKGEMIVLFGPSGSGKSTLLHIIGCLDRPTKGKLYIDGEDISKLPDDKLALIRRDKMGFVFQQFNLINVFTALENVEMPMKIANVDKDESRKRAEKLLKLVNLEKRLDHFPNQLSGGEIQRVAIARALANEPSVILADEPTGNLDSKNGKEIIEIMCKLHKKGYTFVIVTHDTKVAVSAERKISLKDGKIVGGN